MEGDRGILQETLEPEDGDKPWLNGTVQGSSRSGGRVAGLGDGRVDREGI